jgi:hypothetical protein
MLPDLSFAPARTQAIRPITPGWASRCSAFAWECTGWKSEFIPPPTLYRGQPTPALGGLEVQRHGSSLGVLIFRAANLFPKVPRRSCSPRGGRCDCRSRMSKMESRSTGSLQGDDQDLPSPAWWSESAIVDASEVCSSQISRRGRMEDPPPSRRSTPSRPRPPRMRSPRPVTTSPSSTRAAAFIASLHDVALAEIVPATARASRPAVTPRGPRGCDTRCPRNRQSLCIPSGCDTRCPLSSIARSPVASEMTHDEQPHTGATAARRATW